MLIFPGKIMRVIMRVILAIIVIQMSIIALRDSHARNAIKLIFSNPIFGSGASAFPSYLETNFGIWKHTHNLPFEIAVSYGIPSALFILIPFSKMITTSYKVIFINMQYQVKDKQIDKAWFCSLLLLAIFTPPPFPLPPA